MSRHSKTRRRLTYLLGGALVLGTLAGGGALYRLHYLKQRALQSRTQGMDAMARDDYANALVLLGKYLGRNQTDATTLLSYAKARRMVEEPNGRHLGQAISLYQRVLDLNPGQGDAQNALLELYYQVGYNPEAIAMAKTLLEKDPNDTKARRIEVLTLMRMQKLDQAESEVQKLTKIAPKDLEFHMLALQIMVNHGKVNGIEAPDRVKAYADQLAKASPDDVRFELLKCIAAEIGNDRKTATAIIRPLVNGPQPDAAFTRVLIRQLDSLGLFADAFTVLQQSAKRGPSPEILQTWIRRLFETNRLSLLLDQTASLDPAAATTDVEVLGLRTLALARSDRRPEADKILASLDRRGKTELAAARWAAVVRALIAGDSSDPIGTINLLRDTLSGNTSNPILLFELGNAYSAAGANDKAVSAWRDAALVAPAWSEPLVRLSQAFMSAGRLADAQAAAKAAEIRSPDDHEVLVNLAVTTVSGLPEGRSTEATKVLSTIGDLEKKFPDDHRLLSLRAAVLARSGQRDAAIALIRSAISASSPLPANVLLSLANLSQSFKFEQEEACFDACQKAHGLTVDLAFSRARWLYDHQHAPEALAFLEQARTTHPKDVLWGNMWAVYLDQVGDARAKAEWVALGDDNPKNVKIQWAALAARAVQEDHAFVGRTLDRIVALLGDDSPSLRLVRARWLLQDASNEKDTAQASMLLGEISRGAPDMVAPHLLLATCYMRMGNVSGAIDQLAAVSDMQPDQSNVALELARLLQSRGDFTRARQYIDRAAASKGATIDSVRQTATLLASQGDNTTALAMMEKAYAGSKDTPADLVLAALYRQANQLQKTDAICKRLLEKPDAGSIAFAADFYATQKRPDDAQKALTLLDGLKLPDGIKETIRANFASRNGTVEQALALYQAATQAAPTQDAVWQQMIAFCLGTGHIDEALAASEQAVKKCTTPATFEVLRKNAGLVHDSAKFSGTHQLLMMLADDSSNTDQAVEALRIIVAAQQDKEPARSTAAKLRKLADLNPRILPLQTVTLQFLMESGQADEAVRLATRAVQTFPSALEPLRLATQAHGQARQWNEALDTAKQWRRLSAGDDLDADLAIASVQLHMGNADAAARQIEPYLDRARTDPDKFSGVILMHAQGLLARHQPAQVETLLVPLLSHSPQWRNLWLSLTVRGVEESERAKSWLEQVAPLMQKDLSERSMLAQAWIAVGKRWSKPDFDKKGRQLLEETVRDPNAPASALLYWGSLCEGTSDWAGAEKAYRQVIQKDPKAAVAFNNLAYVLVQAHGNLDDAQQLISKALELVPNEPPFLDTKASVLAARKDYAGAIACLKEAQRLDSSNPLWRVNMLQVLVDSGQAAAARAELRQISASFDSNPSMPPTLRQRFDALRAKLQ